MAILVLPPPQQGQEAPSQPNYGSIFKKADAMIPMRDGVKLHTEIYVPKDVKETLPFFLTRTPYGLADDPSGYSRRPSEYIARSNFLRVSSFLSLLIDRFI